MSKNFIYFPSFSVGSFGSSLQKDLKLRNGLPVRFYSEEFPERFRHPYFLVTAGHFYKKTDLRKEWGLDQKGVITLGDSGGYQIASGAIKWDKSIRPLILDWLESNSDIAMNLDIPPRLKYLGKFDECLEISYDNFKYFDSNRKGNTKFLNVLQGDNDQSYIQWYKKVKDFEFSGWGIGGCGGSLYRFMAGIATLMHGKEQYKKNNEYLHILGTSKVIDFLILSRLQKSLNDVGSEIQVTTDSSTPSRQIVFGNYAHNVNFTKPCFNLIHIPKEYSDTNRSFSKQTENKLSQDNESLLPNVIPFDSLLEGGYTKDDLVNWKSEGYAAAVMHNFMFFNDIISKINSYIDGHPYILAQVINDNVFLLLKSIDEMVFAYENGTTPLKVFAKYTPLYTKMSTIKDDDLTNEFF